MADTLKFGPEWLRALSDGTNVSSPPPSPAVGMPMYKLAEYRYGREEMLALCQPSRERPEEFKEFPALVSDKMLQPLALIPLAEDEQRLMSQSVNSTVVLRMMGRGSSGPPIRGGRGGSDRGRGRGRGRGDAYYARGPYDDTEGGGFGRGRIPRDTWDEGRGGRYERTYPAGRSFEEEITSPPRRDFSRSMSNENWRDTKKDEEEEVGGDWRKAPSRDRWGVRSWREPRERYERENYDRSGRYEDYRDRPPYERGRFPRTRSTGSYEDDGEYDLPEWSTEDVDDMESLGTFDSSGAFMSLKDKMGEPTEALTRSSDRSSEERTETSSDPPVEEERGSSPAVSSEPPEAQEIHSEKTEPAEKSANLSCKELKDASHTESHLSESTTVTEQLESCQRQQDKTADGKSRKEGQTRPSVNNTDSIQPLTSDSNKAVNMNSEDKATVSQEEADFDHLEKAAESLVATLGVEEEQGQLDKEAAGLSQPGSAVTVSSEALPTDHEDSRKWFYQDPQGDLQGPFMSSEMAEWFSAGYFTMNLLVKRGCDERFQALGELIKGWGRVPFLPGSSPPPLKTSPRVDTVPGLTSSAVSEPLPASAATVSGIPGIPAAPVPAIPSASVPGMPLVSVAGIPAVGIAGLPAVSLPAGLTASSDSATGVQSADQLKAMQQQMLMHQQIMQQQLLRQMQLQQIMQQLQNQPEFSNMAVNQLQQHALKVLVQQQVMAMQHQQQLSQTTQPTVKPSSPAVGLQPKLSPNSTTEANVQRSELLQRTLSLAQTAVKPDKPEFQRSHSQPGSEENQESIWGGPASSNPGWKSQAKSVWDIEAKAAPTIEKIQREIAEQSAREQEELEEKKLEERRREEARRREEQEEKLKQEKIQREKEAARAKAQLELERRQELERQRLEQLAREQEELRLKQEEEEKKQMEEKRRQEERRRREEERRRQEQERLLEEQRRQEEEERLQKESEEKKRQEEIKRRQEKYEELRRQQHQEALRRMKQEQLANIQLPATAHWANSSAGNTSSSVTGVTSSGTLSLTQIQQMEAQRERKEQEQRRNLEIQQRQQMAALQQQQQHLQGRSWASAAQSHMNTAPGTKSLLEIQQEQAQQQNDSSSSKSQQPPKPPVPLVSGGVWSGGPHSQGWAQEGAWGNPKTKAALGFWDEALSSAPTPTRTAEAKKAASNNNSHFPSLSNCQTNGSRGSSKTKKSSKDEETVQRLFQTLKPKDEFTQWCENALNGMQTSVDIPTFVAFLMEVDSPYEVHDYVRSYLGESRDATEFGRQFLEKRSKYKTQIRQQQKQQPEDDIWGPAPAINPSQGRGSASNQNNNAEDTKLSKKKKKKMQKVDQSFLGFTVHAAPDRINIGSIDTGAAE